MNKSILIGRITADPELRHTQSGVASCRFTLAVNRKYKNEQGEYEADFITCVAWRQTAEFVSRYFSKGKMIAVEGTLHTGSYQDKNYPDVKHYTTDVYVDNVEFCGDKGSSTTAPATAPQSYTPTAQPQPTQAAAQAPIEQSFDLRFDFVWIVNCFVRYRTAATTSPG